MEKSAILGEEEWPRDLNLIKNLLYILEDIYILEDEMKSEKNQPRNIAQLEKLLNRF